MRNLMAALTGKIRARDIARAHLDTLSNTQVSPEGRTVERPSAGDRLTFFGLPVITGGALWVLGIEAPSAEPLLAAIAVLTGLLFALLVLMFERVAQERNIPAPAAGNDPVVDAWQILANVAWAILVSLALLLVLFGATLATTATLPAWLTAVVAVLFLHLALTLVMILRRVFLVAMRIAGPRRIPEAQR